MVPLRVPYKGSIGVRVWNLRALTFLGFYMNYNKEAKSLTFRRGSEVSQGYRVSGSGCTWGGVKY